MPCMTRLSAQSNPPIDARPSRSFVYFAIAIIALLLISIMALLLYRALTVRPPEAVLIVQGDPQWDQAALIVDGPSLPHPQTAVLEKANKFFVSFFLQPGKYTLHVRDGDRELLRE